MYDLQKAFDSVEYPVHKVFDADINGNMWRLLKDWYEDGSCQVKLDGNFQLGLGLREG